MYRIDRSNNVIEPLNKCEFGKLGLRERAHLQEWIAKYPRALGEELLVIQKEFAGFSDTQERLDLLALDKEGSLVIIEHKLDDTGRDVTWQALKYASYCARLTKEEIRQIYQVYLDRAEPNQKAEDRLSRFFDDKDFEELTLNKGLTQRIIMVAANFRKEVTSTALWLMNFKIRIQCFKVTPFSRGDELFLNVEQIIPIKDAEEYMIRVAEKTRGEFENEEAEQQRHRIRREFWAKVIEAMAERSDLYRNISPGTHPYLSAGTGVRGIRWNFGATRSDASANLDIDRGDRNENKRIFDALFSQRQAIEADFGGELIWERLDERQVSRVKAEAEGNIYDQERWEEMIDYMTDAMVRLEKAIKSRVRQVAAG
jgi:hypothetical protein